MQKTGNTAWEATVGSFYNFHCSFLSWEFPFFRTFGKLKKSEKANGRQIHGLENRSNHRAIFQSRNKSFMSQDYLPSSEVCKNFILGAITT